MYDVLFCYIISTNQLSLNLWWDRLSLRDHLLTMRNQTFFQLFLSSTSSFIHVARLRSRHYTCHKAWFYLSSAHLIHLIDRLVSNLLFFFSILSNFIKHFYHILHKHHLVEIETKQAWQLRGIWIFSPGCVHQHLLLFFHEQTQRSERFRFLSLAPEQCARLITFLCPSSSTQHWCILSLLGNAAI
jgi:hypothetical protein